MSGGSNISRKEDIKMVDIEAYKNSYGVGQVWVVNGADRNGKNLELDELAVALEGYIPKTGMHISKIESQRYGLMRDSSYWSSRKGFEGEIIIQKVEDQIEVYLFGDYGTGRSGWGMVVDGGCLWILWPPALILMLLSVFDNATYAGVAVKESLGKACKDLGTSVVE